MIKHPPHAGCFACGAGNPGGLHLDFQLEPDGSISGRFLGSAAFEGYAGTLQHGVVATLLDSALAHCLFARGHCAWASELTVRYFAPVSSGSEITLEARLLRGRFPDCILEAKLLQDGHCKASAKGAYMKQPRIALGLGRARGEGSKGEGS